MKTSAAIAMLLIGACKAGSLETGMVGVDGKPAFRAGFLREMEAANAGKDRIAKLEVLYRKWSNPEEQAEIELALARIYNQQSGFVDYAKSIDWYDKALVRELPPAALAEQFILRGNCHENIEHPREALADYVRGLLVCLRFNLPDKWPKRGSGKLQPPPMNNEFTFGRVRDEARDEARRLADRRRHADYMRDYLATIQDENFLRQRWFYVDAIKRVVTKQKLSEANLRETVEKMSNQEQRIEELLRRVKEPNPRPWP